MAIIDHTAEPDSGDLNLHYDRSSTRKPWRCAHCNSLMYNVEVVHETDEYAHRYPVPGAPQSQYVAAAGGQCCKLCVQMYDVLDQGTYWNALHNEWVSRKTKVAGANYGSL